MSHDIDPFEAAIAGGPDTTPDNDSLAREFTDTPEGFRSGFVSFVGRPNTGKSTLTNALVGQKIAITANQPETTRHPIRGIVNREDAQLIVVDTPGLHRPRTLLGKRLNEMVKETYTDVDVIGVCIPADEKIGPGDRWIVDEVKKVAPRTTLIGIITKIDKASRDQVMTQLLDAQALLGEHVELVPVSSLTETQIDVLAEVITQALPEGPRFYPLDTVTDEPQNVRIAELIREAALSGLKDELPHSVAVQVEEIIRDEQGRATIHATLFVERSGQKQIIIGKDGRRMGRIIHNSRQEINALLGERIFLDLHIKVLKDWQRDPKQLGRLGF